MAATTARVLAGLSIATVLSIALGVACRWFVAVERLTLPTVTFLAPVSPIAWLPIAIFLFGIGNKPAIFMVFIALFFAMTLGAINEIDRVNKNYLNVARTMGATKAQLYARVILPAIAPGLLVVLRMNMFAAWMVVLLAEATGVGSGLGQIIMLARNTFNPSLVYFTITLIGILGFLSDFVLRKVQERFLFWAPNAAGIARWPLSAFSPFSSREAVVCRGVGKTWSADTDRAHVAIRDINLDVAPGEFVVLLGPSGCGKSTLLYLIAGLETATAGEIWSFGERVDDPRPSAASSSRKPRSFPGSRCGRTSRSVSPFAAFPPSIGGRSPARRCNASGSPRRSTSGPMNSRAACASASRWRAP